MNIEINLLQFDGVLKKEMNSKLLQFDGVVKK